MDYVYQDYPKCLYAKDGSTVTVLNAEEEGLFTVDGWMTAAQFHASASVSEPEPSGEKKKKAKT